MRARSKTLTPWLAFALLSLSSASAIAAGVDPTTATRAQVAQAQKQFELGRGHLAKKDYEKALAEFRASYDVVASPNTRFSIARALRDMGNYVANSVSAPATTPQKAEAMQAAMAVSAVSPA